MLEKYLNFDLLIEREGERYRARVVDSPAGQATVDFASPFSELELENFVLRVGRSRRSRRREIGMSGPTELETVKVFGSRLFAAVFDDEVQGCLRSSFEEAERQDAGLRIRLRFVDTPELADIPWEYLYNSKLNRFFSLSDQTPLVRYLELPGRIKPLAVTTPLRVLVMISSPSNYPQLDVDQEWAKLHEALADLEQQGQVIVEKLETATLGALQKLLQRGEYHVFHFIGHGGFDPQTQDGLLVLEDNENRGRSVSGHNLGVLLHDHRSLRLAVLNACEGARTSRSDPFAGTAQSLVQQGIPAVIAMQFEISDSAAITLAHALYGAIAAGYSVDAALAEARKTIYGEGNEVEWGTPVLYMRTPDGHVFDLPAQPTIDIPAKTPEEAPPPARPQRSFAESTLVPKYIVVIILVATFLSVIGGAFILYSPKPSTPQPDIQTAQILNSSGGLMQHAFFTHDGYLITVPYGLKNLSSVTVQLEIGGTTRQWQAQIVRRGSFALEAVLLKLNERSPHQGSLPVRNSTSLNPGEEVERYIAPHDRTPGTVKEVSAERNITIDENNTIITVRNIIITSQISSPGEAGAPVVDAKGRVVGMVIGASRTETISIPIEDIRLSFPEAF